MHRVRVLVTFLQARRLSNGLAIVESYLFIRDLFKNKEYK